MTFSARGVSPAVRVATKERGLQVIDATCPLVTKVHNTPTSRRGQHRRMPQECTGRITGRSTLSASRPRE